MKLLKVNNLSKSYMGGIFAVNDVSFEVKKGEIFGFLGPNGAGKTTTIKMIVGLSEIDRGTIEINGIDNKANSIEAKRQFSFVPDSPQIYEKLTGLEYLNFLADVFGVSSAERRSVITKLANLFSLEDALGDIIQSYSHGMQQKLVLIGSLLHNPSLWILDEPMVGLDPSSAHKLKVIMQEHCQQGKSVFFSTHVLEVAEKLCDRIGIIRKGELIFCGTIKELRGEQSQNQSLENLFLELTENE